MRHTTITTKARLIRMGLSILDGILEVASTLQRQNDFFPILLKPHRLDRRSVSQTYMWGKIQQTNSMQKTGMHNLLHHVLWMAQISVSRAGLVENIGRRRNDALKFHEQTFGSGIQIRLRFVVWSSISNRTPAHNIGTTFV